MSYARGKCFDETHHPARVSVVRNNSMVTKVIGLKEMGESNKLKIVPSKVRNLKKYGKIKKDRRV